jgi:hypothetical protein
MIKKGGQGAVRHLSSVRYLRTALLPPARKEACGLSSRPENRPGRPLPDRPGPLKEELCRFLESFELTNEEILSVLPVLHMC